MLKVNSVYKVSFVGDCDNIKKELTTPFCRNEGQCYFYYNYNVYKITPLSYAKTTVVAFSAFDLMWNFDLLLELCNRDKVIVYITDFQKAKRIGYKICKRKLEYILSCPVIFETRNSAKGINKLMQAIELVSTTPSYFYAIENPQLARNSVVGIKSTLFSKIVAYLLKLGGVGKKFL